MIIEQLQGLKFNARTKQFFGLFSVNLIGIPVGIFTSILVTRYLGAEGFGDYKFINSVFNFVIIIFTFGFYQAGNRALVLNTDRQKAKEYYGTELIITGVLFILSAVFLILYALFDNNLQEKNLTDLFFYLIPFSWIFFLNRYFESLFQADNQIKYLAWIRIYPKIAFLISVGLIYFFFSESKINRLAVIWILFFLSQILVFITVIINLDISFNSIKDRLKEIFVFNRIFGFNMYLGTVSSLGFAALTEILISYFGTNNSGVGYYALALTFAMPLTFIPNTIGTTHYKDFSKGISIPKRLILFTFGSSVIALVGLWCVIEPLIHLFYGVEFEKVIQLCFIVSIGVTIHGLGDFFNGYLAANGQGKVIRNSLIFFGFLIMIFNLLLIPTWGEMGAAFSKLITSSIYLLVIFWYYFKFRKDRKKYVSASEDFKC